MFQWLCGWLTHLRRRGGVMHPELTTLARDGDIKTDLESPLTSMNYDVGERTLKPLPGAEPQSFSRNAIAQLLTLLSKPAANAEDPAMDQPRKNAIWATFLMVAPPRSPGGAPVAQAEARLSDVWSQLPGWAQEVSEPHGPHLVQPGRCRADPVLPLAPGIRPRYRR